MENFKDTRESPEPNMLAVQSQSDADPTIGAMNLILIKLRQQWCLPVVTSTVHRVQETAWKHEAHDSFPIPKVDNIVFGLKVD
jgi:hypothetical protein